ncbi:hypothetical protein EV356DRAFT_386587 [Viridothelium virens]|uniref:Uncharacterized protein n=1 Tax=Viridothelium virens TaxID=1048519 RepID=A0A6A6GUQ0_VIRVR|nr:hypothetical protein EV356DRAFT_386587 [Viridothelium virens]
MDLQFYQDKRLATSMNRAYVEDAGMVVELISQEEQANQDHDMALCRARMRVPPQSAEPNDTSTSDGRLEPILVPVPNSAKESQQHDSSSISVASSAFSFPDHPVETAESSHAAACSHSASMAKKAEGAVNRARCVPCGDLVLVFDSVQLPCDPEPHTWCRNCVVKLFEKSIVDEQL